MEEIRDVESPFPYTLGVFFFIFFFFGLFSFYFFEKVLSNSMMKNRCKHDLRKNYHMGNSGVHYGFLIS